MQMKNITWVQAKLSDSKIAGLIGKLTRADKIVETGGCGCGCEDGAAARRHLDSEAKQG
jgi:hypothetical protein